MKKVLVLVMVWVACSTATFAFSPSDYNAFYKLNNKAVFTSLIEYIDADYEQVEFLKNVFKVTEEELKALSKKENQITANQVLNFNLSNTKCILSQDQYRKYLLFVNLYLNNNNDFALYTENK